MVGDCTFEGHTIRYDRMGSGEPVIFLHNGGTSRKIWEPQLAHLADRYDVIAPDLIGYGESSKPKIHYQLDVFVRMLTALIDELELARVSLVANCVGATTALAYAQQYPERVRRIVAMNIYSGATLTGGEFTPAVTLASRSRIGAAAVRGLTATLRLSPERMAKSATAKFQEVPGDNFVEHVGELWKDGQNLRVLGSMLGNVKTFVIPDLSKRPDGKPPICLIWGGANPIAPPAGVEIARELLVPDEVHVIPGGGHMTAREQPDVVNEIIVTFLGVP